MEGLTIPSPASAAEHVSRVTPHSALQVSDLHRHFIDGLTIPSQQGGPPLQRIDEVFDCWFESGSMPYAQLHYPFENKGFFEANFPADFVAEGAHSFRATWVNASCQPAVIYTAALGSHGSFENKGFFEANLPADFVAVGAPALSFGAAHSGDASPSSLQALI